MKVHVKRQVYILLVLLLLLVIIGLVTFDMLQRKSVSLVESTEEVAVVDEATMQSLLDQIEPKIAYDGIGDTTVLQGLVIDGMTLFANGIEVLVYQDNSFELQVVLEEGDNSINVVAVNSAGQQVSREIIITRNSESATEAVVDEPQNSQNTEEPAPTKETSEELSEPEPTATCDQGSFNTQFLCYINDHRVTNGKTTLQLSADLIGVADGHSKWMDDNNLLSHEGENGSTAFDRCDEGNTVCYAENVAYGFSSAKHLFELWRDSSGHNANMLGDYSLLGIGATDEYATALFR